MTSIQEFAAKYGLKCIEEESLFNSRQPSYSIPGGNGYVIENNKNACELQAGIVYLSYWERVKSEFKLSYRHCRVLEPVQHSWSTVPSIRAAFDPTNESQAILIIELAQLVKEESKTSIRAQQD